MLSQSKDLTVEEKNVYINCLAYILNFDKAATMVRKEYLENQIKDIGLSLKDFDKIKKKQKPEDIIKELKSISDIRSKRYILREMILLAIADHELTDDEIKTIFQIGTKSGIKEEKVGDFFLWAAKGIEWEIEGTQLVEENL